MLNAHRQLPHGRPWDEHGITQNTLITYTVSLFIDRHTYTPVGFISKDPNSKQTFIHEILEYQIIDGQQLDFNPFLWRHLYDRHRNTPHQEKIHHASARKEHTMKKIIAIFGVLAVAGILAFVLFNTLIKTEGISPANYQTALKSYIEYQNLHGTDYQIEQTARAQNTAAFSENLNFTTYGDSVHYPTDIDLGTDGLAASKPLPYPPQEVWCALLKTDSDPQYQLVFANLHQDLHNADWIVHAAPQMSRDELKALTTELACPLDIP